MEVIPGKMVTGNMDSNGIFVENLGGSYTGIRRDALGTLNRLNLVWVGNQTWNSNCYFQEVGRIQSTGSGSNSATTVQFSGTYKNVPDMVQLTPIQSGTASESNQVLQYAVRVVEGGYDEESTCNISGDKVNFLGRDGTRYLVDLTDSTVKRLVFVEMEVKAFDFST